MDNTDKICHSGIIKSINTQQIVVSVISQSACVSCHAKGACSASDLQEKEIEITKWQGNFLPGERVEIITNKSQGFRALFLAYLIPLVLMVSALIVLLNYTNNEVLAAMGSLVVLAVYYFILFLMRQYLKSTLKFSIQKSGKN